MRRRHEAAAGSLDSLLDTMTNVVGILVILLVVTQLGVSSAVNRIKSSLPEVNEQQYGEQKRLVRRARTDLARLQRTRVISTEALALARAELAALEQRLRELKQRSTAATLPDLPQLRIEVADNEAAVKRNIARIAPLRKELAAVRADLGKAAKTRGPSANVVRVPDPRPAPPKARPEHYFCRAGRIVRVDPEAAAEKASRRIASRRQLRSDGGKRSIDDFLSSRKLGEQLDDANVEYERKKVEAYFQRERIMSGGQRVLVYGAPTHTGCWVKFKVTTRDGDSPRSLSDFNSLYMQALRGTKSRGNYVQFMVNTDSFEVYLAARKAADENDVPAGWTLFEAKEWRPGQAVPGIRIRREQQPPPPTPSPNPKPKPAVTKPPPPKKVLD